jgi:hypothetical protein
LPVKKRFPIFEAVREDVLARVRDDLQRGSVFYDLHHREPYRLDVFSAAIKDGRGHVLVGAAQILAIEKFV